MADLLGERNTKPNDQTLDIFFCMGKDAMYALRFLQKKNQWKLFENNLALYHWFAYKMWKQWRTRVWGKKIKTFDSLKSMCCSDCHLTEPQKLIYFDNLCRLEFKLLLPKKNPVKTFWRTIWSYNQASRGKHLAAWLPNFQCDSANAFWQLHEKSIQKECAKHK